MEKGELRINEGNFYEYFRYTYSEFLYEVCKKFNKKNEINKDVTSKQIDTFFERVIEEYSIKNIKVKNIEDKFIFTKLALIHFCSKHSIEDFNKYTKETTYRFLKNYKALFILKDKEEELKETRNIISNYIEDITKEVGIIFFRKLSSIEKYDFEDLTKIEQSIYKHIGKFEKIKNIIKDIELEDINKKSLVKDTYNKVENIEKYSSYHIEMIDILYLNTLWIFDNRNHKIIPLFSTISEFLGNFIEKYFNETFFNKGLNKEQFLEKLFIEYCKIS